MTYNRSDILIGITKAFENNDLSFIDTINNITFGYKKELKTKLTQHTNGDYKNTQ